MDERTASRPLSRRAFLAAASGAVAAGAAQARSEPRVVRFGGQRWRVKGGREPMGPGPNWFSDAADDVRVDRQGRLHLRLARRRDRWHSTEVVGTRSLGWGTYAFQVGTPPNRLPLEAVLGLFTWSDDPAWHHREIDVEVGKWLDPANEWSQFVVQPYDRPGNMRRFAVPDGARPVTYAFTWQPRGIEFAAWSGRLDARPAAERLLHAWRYEGPNVPQPGDETPRINLWLFQGKPPADGREREVVIDRFRFAPLS